MIFIFDIVFRWIEDVGDFYWPVIWLAVPSVLMFQ